MLQTEAVAFELSMPWEMVYPDSDNARRLRRELALELAIGHPLHGQEVTIVGRSHQADDVLVEVADGWAIVHLTWSSRPEVAGHPSTDLFDDPAQVQRVIDIQVAEHDGDWETYLRLVGDSGD